eukprot:PITA_04322
MKDSASGEAEMKSAISTPCAACKLLRRRCTNECVFAPYFPPDDPHKFAWVHRVFGASNVNKMLQDLPIDNRADAVSSMVYEAQTRVVDPIYGCAGIVANMQEQMTRLQIQLARAQADIVSLRLQRDQALLSNVTNAANNMTIGQLATMHGTSPASETGQQVRPFFVQGANGSKESMWN